MKAVSRGFKPAACCLVLALTGCGGLLASDYQAPVVNTPDAWRYGTTPGGLASGAGAATSAAANTTASATSAATASGPAPVVVSPVYGGAWWRSFNDPMLNELVEAAFLRNNDLAAAAIRVRRAQLQAGLADDKLMPVLGGNANVSRARTLSGERSTIKNNSAELTVGYEVDLWGKLSRQRDAAQWEAQATEWDRQSAALTLVGTTATLYWQIGFINQRLASGLESIAYARKTQDLVRVQYAAGAASALELAEAEQTVASQLAAQAALVQLRVEYLNALAIVFDGPPDRTMADPATLPQGPLPQAQAGVPAELLGRRPDLQAAESRLRESLANIDATKASYYPPLTLTGSLGSTSAKLAEVLQNPVATLGAGLLLPFLQWNQMQLNIKVSKTDYEERVVNFRQTLYQAMADVENALSARTQLGVQGEQLERSLRAAQQAERLYEVRYRAGAVPLNFWLDAQEKRRVAQIAWDENRLARLLNQVKVYQALGGDEA